MGDPHGGVGGVDVLAARPAGAHRIDADVVRVDLDVDLLGLGQHRDGRRRGMDAAARLGFRHALHAVDPRFEFQPGKHALARDMGGDFLDAAELGLAFLEDLEGPALRLREALVHAEQVAGEQRRLLAAGAGADLDHRGTGIGRVLGQERQLQRMLGPGQLGLQPRQLLFGKGAHLGIGQHFLGLGHVGHEAAPGLDLADDGLQFAVFA